MRNPITKRMIYSRMEKYGSVGERQEFISAVRQVQDILKQDKAFVRKTLRDESYARKVQFVLNQLQGVCGYFEHLALKKIERELNGLSQEEEDNE